LTPGARLQAVIDLYNAIQDGRKPSDQVMHDYFRQRKYIGSKDRRDVAETLYEILRHYARLSWWADRVNFKKNGRGLVLLGLVLGRGRKSRDIAELFDGAGYAPDSLKGFERDVLDELQNADLMPDEMPEDVCLECPVWAYEALKKHFGADLAKEMNAMQEEAPLDLRVNTLKADPESVLKKLRRDDFDVKPALYSPIGLRVIGRPNFSAHPLYREGALEVQDEGSQILSLLCGVKPGQWVVDFCAGAGGKTLALAAQMENKGRLWACDIGESRLENAKKRLRRAGVHCVQLQLIDDENDDWVKKHAGKADCVLIDAPCSGSGTWRRNPFSRWQDLGPSLKSLTDIQGKILKSASRLVKSGGRLIYATCSLLPEENQNQVGAFLKAHPEFQPVPLAENPIEGLDLSEFQLQMTPARHGTDGFFIAALKRS
jgi:16S rRNA (cytosine967-C5)-methyltransferase